MNLLVVSVINYQKFLRSISPCFLSIIAKPVIVNYRLCYAMNTIITMLYPSALSKKRAIPQPDVTWGILYILHQILRRLAL